MKIWYRYLRFIPVALIMGIIFFLSHHQGSELPLPPVPGIDKLIHALAYAALAGTAIFAFFPETRQQRALFVSLMVILFCMLYGIADEFHQSFIPGRNPSSADVIADTLGAVLMVYGWTRFSMSKNMETA